MVLGNDRSFGGSNRYFAQQSLTGARRLGPKDDSEEEAKIRKLLKSYQSDLSKRVELCCKQWNQTIRGHIKNEMALDITIGDGKQHAPVRVVDGLPGPFAEIVRGLPDIEVWELILNRPLLLRTLEGLELVDKKYDFITRWQAMQNHLINKKEMEHVHKFISALTDNLEELELIKKISDIDQDILGAYYFRIPEIQIYWMVIGVIAGILGITTEVLTLVVLTHELAHAYSHLGHDIDGEQWKTETFAAADIGIVEGLAQFYTSVVCEQISARNPGVKEAYERLLNLQRGPYRVHENWKADEERAGEVVRFGLIECRSKGITQYQEFEKRLSEARTRIGRRHKTSQPKLF